MTGPEDPTPVGTPITPGKTALQDLVVKKAPKPSRKPWWEKFRTVAQGLAPLIVAISGLVIGILATYKGEDAQEQAVSAQQGVDESWIKTRNQVNRLTEGFNKLQLWIVAMQARQEERTAMKLLAQLENLQERYEALLKKKRTPLLSRPAQPFHRPKPKASGKPALLPQLPQSYRKGK